MWILLPGQIRKGEHISWRLLFAVNSRRCIAYRSCQKQFMSFLLTGFFLTWESSQKSHLKATHYSRAGESRSTHSSRFYLV